MFKPTTQLFALLTVMLAGCGGAETPDDAGNLLAPPPPGEGIQVRMANTVSPGEEFEHCQFFVVPPGGINLSRETTRYLSGSHHVLLYATAYTAVPTANLRQELVDTSGEFDCSAGVFGYWKVTGIAAAAQNPNSPDVVLPPGVAIRLPAGSVMLMNTHYLNPTSEPLETDTRINLYSIPDAAVKTEGGFLTFYNPFIVVPAFGSSTARMRCPVPQDVNLVTLSSHMHRRGVHFRADLVDAEGDLQGTLFETDEWENVSTQQWLAGRSIQAGAALDFRCDYENPEGRVVIQGPTTKDEMCVLVGAYYPRDLEFEFCSSLGISNPNHEAIWIGDGKLSCLEAAVCAAAATNAASFFGCVVDSCPASGPSLSALLHCRSDAAHGPGSACGETCKHDSSPSACQSCIVKNCGSQISACAAASCE